MPAERPISPEDYDTPFIRLVRLSPGGAINPQARWAALEAMDEAELTGIEMMIDDEHARILAAGAMPCFESLQEAINSVRAKRASDAMGCFGIA